MIDVISRHISHHNDSMHNFVNMDERARSLICLILLICIGYSEIQANVNFCGERVPCDDWECIDRGKWCNGETDCYDKSDEKYCLIAKSWFGFRSVDNKCTEQHFKCDNDQCVPVVTKCDGYEDCKDGSDEHGCDEKSSEASLSNEDSIREDTSEDNKDEDFWDTSVTTIERETSFPDIFESTEPPVMVLIPSTTPDYYSRRMSKESADRQKQAGNQEFDYNSRRDHHQEPYPGRQNEPRQQSQHHDTRHYTRTSTELTRQSEIFRGSSQFSGGSDTAPAASFPSNEYRPPSPSPVYYRHPSPPTTDPISFSPSPLSVYKDTERLPRRQPQSQTGYSAEYHPNSRNYPVNDYHTQRTCRDYSQQRNPDSSPRQKIALSPFNFQQNYTARNERRYKDTIRRAETWLIDQRNSFYGWGNDTARALVALSLITNSFLSNVGENNFMKKSLQTHLGIKLLTELNETNLYKSKEHSIKFAQYINALLATCQDPRDFFGQDLVERLVEVKNNELRQRYENPFIYITLCLVNATITRNDVERLEDLLNLEDSDESTKDMQILATIALACLQRNNPEFRLQQQVEKASRKLLRWQPSDGSFGSIYSTAIAAQALISLETGFDLRQTLDYLKRNQSNDGSFGDMLATYYILPVLSGRSLLHLRNTQCEPPPPVIGKDWSPLDILNVPGPKVRVSYTMKIGNPPTTTIPTHISVPTGTSFFDILRIVQLLNPVFKFSYKEISDKIDVHTISNIPNDPERGYYWYLYDHEIESPTRNQEYTGDIRELCPRDLQHLVYWYH